MLSTTDIVIRLLTALACGAVIGLNRDIRGKPAGFRTFGLVGLGSALVVIVMHDSGQLTLTWIALVLGLLVLVLGRPVERLLERLLKPRRRKSRVPSDPPTP
jgi:uncharacterized membrane protein YhiD involved in acid resistance